MTTPVTIIAEAGVNHNGDIGRARDMVWAAREAGADVVKFQAFTTETIVSPSAETAAYQAANTGIASQFELIKALELPPAAFGELAEECRKAGIAFLATPFDETMTAGLVALGMPAIKVASGEATNAPALRHFASFGLPVWLSTGMCTLDEVRAAIDVLATAGCKDVTVLHCTSLYPAPPATLNLNAIATLASSLGRPVGYSDHSLGDHAAIAAVALGATLIEKHFTLDCSLPGPDHRASLEPAALAAMVRRIRELEVMLGDGIKRPQAGEPETAALVRRSWHAARDISAGTTLAAHDVRLIRPASGLAPDRSPVGRRAARPLAAGDAVTTDDLIHDEQA